MTTPPVPQPSQESEREAFFAWWEREVTSVRPSGSHADLLPSIFSAGAAWQADRAPRPPPSREEVVPPEIEDAINRLRESARTDVVQQARDTDALRFAIRDALASPRPPAELVACPDCDAGHHAFRIDCETKRTVYHTLPSGQVIRCAKSAAPPPTAPAATERTAERHAVTTEPSGLDSPRRPSESGVTAGETAHSTAPAATEAEVRRAATTAARSAVNSVRFSDLNFRREEGLDELVARAVEAAVAEWRAK